MDVVFLVGVEAVGRFVHDQDFRVVQHRLGQPDAALEPLRQGFDGLAEDFPQIDLVDDVVDAAAFFRPVEAAHLGDETQKGFRRHVAVGGRAFGQVTDAALDLDRVAGDVEAANLGRSRRRFDETGHHAHGRRFSGPVGAQKAQDFAAGDGQGDIVDGQKRPEPLGQALEGDLLRHDGVPRFPFSYGPDTVDKRGQNICPNVAEFWATAGI